MIKHTKFAKSNIPLVLKSKRKKNLKKVVSSCATPRKIFSKSTSRTGSPLPKTTKQVKKIVIQMPRIKVSVSSPRLKFGAIHSYVSSTAKGSSKLKKTLTIKKSKASSQNLSPKHQTKIESMASVHKEIIDLKEKVKKNRSENSNLTQLKEVLNQVLKENSIVYK